MEVIIGNIPNQRKPRADIKTIVFGEGQEIIIHSDNQGRILDVIVIVLKDIPIENQRVTDVAVKLQMPPIAKGRISGDTEVTGQQYGGME
jgi:hypothetical protein